MQSTLFINTNHHTTLETKIKVSKKLQVSFIVIQKGERFTTVPQKVFMGKMSSSFDSGAAK